MVDEQGNTAVMIAAREGHKKAGMIRGAAPRHLYHLGLLVIPSRMNKKLIPMGISKFKVKLADQPLLYIGVTPWIRDPTSGGGGFDRSRGRSVDPKSGESDGRRFGKNGDRVIAVGS